MVLLGTDVRRQWQSDHRRHNCATVGTADAELHVERLGRPVPQDGTKQPLPGNQFQSHSRTTPDNATAIRRTIDGFVCPSNRRPQTINSGTGATTTSQLGPSDYRGNMAAGMMIPTSANGCSHDAPVHADLPLLRQRRHLPELDRQHGRHHRRHAPHDPDRREHLAARCLVAGDECRRSDQHRPDHQPADQCQNGVHSTGPIGPASTPVRSISVSATAASGP